MAFEGDLSKLELGDVFQTLSMTRQHGTLVIQGAEERRLAFGDRGIALLSARPSQGEHICRFLLAKGELDEETLAAARKAMRRERGSRLDEVIEGQGSVSTEALRAARHYVAEDDLFEMFTWHSGAFEFLEGDEAWTGPFAEFWFNIGGVSMEAARRMDELPGLDEQVPQGSVLRPAEDGEGLDPETDPADTLTIAALADGSRSAADIVSLVHLGAFDTRKRLAGLLERGVLRHATTDEILDAAAEARSARQLDQAVRLLSRAVEIDPDDPSLWQQLATLHRENGAKRDAASAMERVARAQLDSGDADGAVKTLQKALKTDSGNLAAHETLAAVLLQQDDVQSAVDAARTAAKHCLAAEDYEAAIRLAGRAVELDPNDLQLRMTLSNALIGAERGEEAMIHLSELADAMEVEGRHDRRLIDVYRAILQLHPDRKDADRRISEIFAAAEARRRSVGIRIAIAAAVLVAGVLAIPFLGGPSVEARVSDAQEFLDEGLLPEAVEIVEQLESESLSEDDAITVQGLRFRITQDQNPDASLPSRNLLAGELEVLYREADSAIEAHAIGDGLTKLLAAVEIVQGERGSAAGDYVGELRKNLVTEVTASLKDVEQKSLTLGAVANEVRNDFGQSTEFHDADFGVQVADLEELQRLVDAAETVSAMQSSEDWDAVTEQVAQLTERVTPDAAATRERIGEALAALTESFVSVREQGELALAYLNRAQLMQRFKETQRDAGDAKRAGRLEEAADAYRGYLEFCTSLSAEPRGPGYERIVFGYMEALPLQALHRAALGEIERVLDGEREADGALEAENFRRAFRIRAELVRSEPTIDFTERFRLPLRVISRPAGAEVLRLDEGGEQWLGTTPLTIEYAVTGETKLAVRREGFDESLLTRLGALDDRDGEVVVDLTKQELWRSAPSGHSESQPIVWKDRIFVADREGVVRALSLAGGNEIARFDAELLGGFAAALTVFNGRVHVASVDNTGYVLDANSLGELHRYELDGPVRAGLVATDRGVVVADGSGTVRLVDNSGVSLWKQHVGRIAVDPAISPEGIVVCTTSGDLVVLNITNGRERHRISLPGDDLWAPPVVKDGLAYIGCTGGTLTAVDLRAGRIRWSNPIGEEIVGRAALAGGRLVVGTGRGTAHIVDSGSGETVRTLDTAGPVRVGCVELDGDFVIVTGTGRVQRIDREGETVWRFDTGDTVVAPPTVIDGSVIVVTRRGTVIALAP